MNILFLSAALGPDYQCDMVLHGLRELYGNFVVDFPRIPYMYAGYSGLHGLYGRGFTLYGLLPDERLGDLTRTYADASPPPIDRTDVEAKIREHFYDIIVYGSILRSNIFFPTVAKHYRREEVLLIDGEDQQHLALDLCRHGLYFKRELLRPHEGVFPIHFAIPACKIGTLASTPKTHVMAYIDPRDRSTYIYSNEADYYRDYASSLFAITCHKAGWDTLRTLEIMANRCIPLFLDLKECPLTTCINLPKAELLEALDYLDRPGPYWDSPEGRATWLSLFRRIYPHFVRYSTTRALAEYLLTTQLKEASAACPTS